MTPQTSQPVLAPVVREGRLKRLMQSWRARTPAQRRTSGLMALFTLAVLTLDIGAVSLGVHLVRDATQTSSQIEQVVTLPSGQESALWQPLMRWDAQFEGRVNTWRRLYGLTMGTAFAAFALAWGLGNLTVALMFAWPRRDRLVRTMSEYGHRIMQLGIVFLAVGMLSSACWGADSCGRFWNWDPREVWTLVVLLTYLLTVYARSAGWILHRGLAVCSVLAFASVIMAWYGGNFILQTGLNANGVGNPSILWVTWAGLTNLACVAHWALRNGSAVRKGQPLAGEPSC
jgi:ABC-type transport system involved in cytochrome c biogenesis permease subunit